MSAPSENHYRQRIKAVSEDLTRRYFPVCVPHVSVVDGIAQEVVDAQIEAAQDMAVVRREEAA